MHYQFPLFSPAKSIHSSSNYYYEHIPMAIARSLFLLLKTTTPSNTDIERVKISKAHVYVRHEFAQNFLNDNWNVCGYAESCLKNTYCGAKTFFSQRQLSNNSGMWKCWHDSCFNSAFSKKPSQAMSGSKGHVRCWNCEQCKHSMLIHKDQLEWCWHFQK